MATASVPATFQRELAAFRKGVEDGFTGSVLPEFTTRIFRLIAVPPQVGKGDQGVEFHSDRYRSEDKLLECLQDGG